MATTTIGLSPQAFPPPGHLRLAFRALNFMLTPSKGMQNVKIR
jgi:hypothetical protein